MKYFDAEEGKRYFPFGSGSGDKVVEQFGIPNLFDLPIRPEVSLSTHPPLTSITPQSPSFPPSLPSCEVTIP